MPLLEARGVTIRFGGLTAVADFNLAVEQHELAGLIGPNGAGKTTIFNILTGGYAPTEGETAFDGQPPTACKPYEITPPGVPRPFQNIPPLKHPTRPENGKIGAVHPPKN